MNKKVFRRAISMVLACAGGMAGCAELTESGQYGIEQGDVETAVGPLWSLGSAEAFHSVDTFYPSPSCIAPIPRTLDVFEANFAGASHGIAAVILDEGAFERLVVYRTDLRDVFDDLDRFPLEILEEIVLPYETRDPVALSIGESLYMPTVAGHSGSYEQAIGILYDDGYIRVFAPEDSTTYHTSRAWPAHFVHDTSTNLIAPPSLPGGVTVREYCDLAFIQSGDIFVTFAQNPLVSNPLKPADFVMREGFMRFDRSLGTWEAPVTGFGSSDFLHRQPTFDRTGCMSVDGTTERDDILIAMNNVDGILSNPRQVWGLDYTATAPFAIDWLGNLPSTGSYGNVEGVVYLDDDHFGVMHDVSSSGDKFRVFEVNGAVLDHLALASTAGVAGMELSSLAMTPVAASGGCDNVIGLSAWNNEGGSSSDTCDAIAVVTYSDCP